MLVVLLLQALGLEDSHIPTFWLLPSLEVQVTDVSADKPTISWPTLLRGLASGF